MADNESTTETTDEVVTAEVEANEDTDVDLEDMEVSFDDAEDDSDDEAEAEPDEEADTEGEPEVEEEAEVEADADTEAEPEPKEELSDEDAIKQRNREMAEKRIQERQARQAAIKQEQDAYIAEAEDEYALAVRQLQVDAYDTKVEANTNKLTNGYEKALKDFAILNDPSPEIQSELNQALDAFQAMYVDLDRYGNPTNVKGDLYAYLQTKADIIEKLAGLGARQQVKSKDREKSKVLATPSRAPKEPKKDPDLDGFEEEANRW